MRSAAALALVALACATRLPVEPGVLRGGVYENAAFDLRVVLPPGWAFLSLAEIEASVRSAYADRPATARSVRSALDGKTTLFTMVDRAHAPAPGRARRSVAAHAARLPEPPAGLTSEAIATELENALRAGDVPIEIGARRQAIVGGRRFVVVPTEMERDGIRGRLDHHLRYQDGRLLVLTVTYPPEESAPPQEAIEAIRPFQPTKGEP